MNARARYVTVIQAVDDRGEVKAGVATWGAGFREQKSLAVENPGTTIKTVQVEAVGALAKLLDERA